MDCCPGKEPYDLVVRILHGAVVLVPQSQGSESAVSDPPRILPKKMPGGSANAVDRPAKIAYSCQKTRRQSPPADCRCSSESYRNRRPHCCRNRNRSCCALSECRRRTSDYDARESPRHVSWKWKVASCSLVGPCGLGPRLKLGVVMTGGAVPAGSSELTLVNPSAEGGVVSCGTACKSCAAVAGKDELIQHRRAEVMHPADGTQLGTEESIKARTDGTRCRPWRRH